MPLVVPSPIVFAAATATADDDEEEDDEVRAVPSEGRTIAIRAAI